MSPTMTISHPWLVQDSGPLSATENMAIDRAALDAMDGTLLEEPVMRFFQWESASVTYGYLLEPAKVKSWALPYGVGEIVKRPTGGGAVYHQESDLSFSLLWPRRRGILSDKPRDCYEQIHRAVLAVIGTSFGGNAALFAKEAGTCEEPTNEQGAKRFSICFQEPVCNDVMADGRKILGGALRLTRHAVLYQGHLQLTTDLDLDRIKSSLVSALPAALART